MSLRLRTLTTESELLRFAVGFDQTLRERSGGRQKSQVPIEYLRRCHAVRALFDSDGRMVAGYAVGAAPPYRLLDFVPEPARQKLLPPDGATWEDCCEITCVWRRSSLPSWVMGMRVWPFVLVDVLTANRTFVLGGDQNVRIDAKYQRLTGGLQTLYLGPSTYGFDSRLFAFTRWAAMRGGLWAAVVDPLRRLFLRKKPRSRKVPAVLSAGPVASREPSIAG